MESQTCTTVCVIRHNDTFIYSLLERISAAGALIVYDQRIIFVLIYIYMYMVPCVFLEVLSSCLQCDFFRDLLA